jgi:hypothetical protein
MIGWTLMAAAAGASAQPSEDPCSQAEACRQVGTVRVEDARGQETLLTVDQTLPWMVQDNLMLVPGDWIIVQFVDRNRTLVPRLVKAGNGSEAPEPANGELRIKVHAFDKGTLIMEILSRHRETLDYAALTVIGKDAPQRASVCSVSPGLTVFESWQSPIRQVVLWGFRPTNHRGCKVLDRIRIRVEDDAPL